MNDVNDVNDVLDSLDIESQAYINALTNDEFYEIVTKAHNESEELTENDINNILDTIDNSSSHYLKNNNTESIINEIHNIILENDIPNPENVIYKLTKYRYIDEINQIVKGRNIKYVNKNTKIFKNGGLVLDVKFLENGTHILCKGFNNFVKQIKFDDSIIFQALTTEEQIILMSNSVIL